MNDLDNVLTNLEGWRAKIKEEVTAELKDQIRKECEAELKEKMEEQIRFQLEWKIKSELDGEARKRKKFEKDIIGMSVEDAKLMAEVKGFSIDVRWEDGKSTGGRADGFDTGNINVYVLNGKIQSGKLSQQYTDWWGKMDVVKEPWWG